MKHLFRILFIGIVISCSNLKDNRLEILGRDFANSDIKSIEIVEIGHPMLGGTIEAFKLSKQQELKFLEDFDKLNKKGMYKCPAKYVIRLNFESDTLMLKVCGSKVSNRNNEIYYSLRNSRDIIKEYID